MELRYMKILRCLLGLLFAWPHHIFGDNYKAPFYRNTVTIFSEGAFVIVSGTIYIKTNFSIISFMEMGKTYLNIFMSITATHRITIPWFQSYHKLMRQFLLEGHLFHHRHKSVYFELMYQKIHRVCHIFVMFICVELCFGMVFFNVTPLWNNYSNGMFTEDRQAGMRFENAIDYIVPFIDQHNDLNAYILISFVNLLLTLDCGLNFVTYDITLFVIVFHVWGHLGILDHNLRSIPTPAEMRNHQPTRAFEDMSYTEEENIKVSAILKDMINHHKMIRNFMAATSDAFGPMLCVYCIFHQVSGCLLLLECSALDVQSLMRYGSLTLIIFQYLIQVSVVVELLGSQSEQLKDAVYSVPWESMDTTNRKLVLFLLFNVQKPIRLKPMGMVSVGVSTMTVILKTSISYFMMLRTFT